MNKCLYCDKEISDKAKYCSEAHRKAYQRRTQAGHQPGQNDPEFNPDTRDLSDLGLTRTDAAFEAYKPNYYKFSDKVFTRKCIALTNKKAGTVCNKEFKTHLSLLKFCSPECQLRTLNHLAGLEQWSSYAQWSHD